MRSVSDETIIAQAAQPDMHYRSSINVIDIARSLNYTYDDYVALAKASEKHVYGRGQYDEYLQSIEAVEQAGGTLALHW